MLKSTSSQRLASALAVVVAVAAVMATTAHGHSVYGNAAVAAAVHTQQRRMQPRLVTSWIQSQQQQQQAAEYPATPPSARLDAADANANVAAAAVAVAVNADAARRLKASSTPLASVVEDWSLVCKELCGAGLGGMPCAAQCTEADKAAAATNAATLILPNGMDLICRDLCAMQLGAANCKCESAVDTANANVNANGVCHTFCVHNNNITPNGCSACTTATATAVNEAVHPALAFLELELPVPQQQPVAAADAGISTTTPDWNELCESLCKTGDGGSLCNCDLSPFKK